MPLGGSCHGSIPGTPSSVARTVTGSIVETRQQLSGFSADSEKSGQPVLDFEIEVRLG